MTDKISADQTVVLVSQSPAEIVKLCDKAIWIRDSRIVKYGDPTLVADAYVSNKP